MVRGQVDTRHDRTIGVTDDEALDALAKLMRHHYGTNPGDAITSAHPQTTAVLLLLARRGWCTIQHATDGGVRAVWTPRHEERG